MYVLHVLTAGKHNTHQYLNSFPPSIPLSVPPSILSSSLSLPPNYPLSTPPFFPYFGDKSHPVAQVGWELVTQPRLVLDSTQSSGLGLFERFRAINTAMFASVPPTTN